MTTERKLRLVVVIINYKTPDLITGALKSLAREIDPERDRVVVVDNFSDDGSVEKISAVIRENEWGHWAELVASPINGGFSAGNNVGIKHHDAEYYLLLNSDAYVSDNALPTMIRKMEENDQVGIVGPAIIWEDGGKQVSCFNNATPAGEFVALASTGLISRFMRLFGVKEIPIADPVDDERPEWISFCCVMIRRDVINDVGLMDEGYFMYYEDNDYCRMARMKGWDILYAGDAKAVHLNKGYSNKRNTRLPDYVYRSRSRYFIKHYGKFGLLLANIFWIKGWFIARIRNLFRSDKKPGRPKAFTDIWKGFSQ